MYTAAMAIERGRQLVAVNPTAQRYPLAEKFLKQRSMQPTTQLTLLQYNKFVLDWQSAAGIARPALN